MAERKLYGAFGLGAVPETHRDAVAHGTLLRIVIITCITGIFDDLHLGAQRVDARVGGDLLLEVMIVQLPE